MVIFLGTNSNFGQNAKQILENRPVFIEWEQNIILLGQKNVTVAFMLPKAFCNQFDFKKKEKTN